MDKEDSDSISRLFLDVVSSSDHYTEEEKLLSIRKRTSAYYEFRTNDSNWIVVCVKTGNDMVGFLESNLEKHDDELVAHNRWMIISKEHQAKGISQKLLALMQDELRKKGIHRMVGYIKPSNQNSIHATSQFGYIKTGKIVNGLLEVTKTV